MKPIKLPGMFDELPGYKTATVIPVRAGSPSVFVFSIGVDPAHNPPKTVVRILKGPNKVCVWEDVSGERIIRVPRGVVQDLAVRLEWKKLELPAGDYEVQIETDSDSRRFFANLTAGQA